MNTTTVLESLTAAIKVNLQGSAILNTTEKNFSRTYSIANSLSTRAAPYGRYQVHVFAQRDSADAVLMCVDYGLNGKGATNSRSSVSLNNIADCATQISQFLLSGK